MAVPASGNAITLGKIYQEIDGAGYSASPDSGEEASLTNMSTGNAPDTLNTNSTNRPDGSTPHAMSEFFSYDHSAVPPFSWDAAAVGRGRPAASRPDRCISPPTPSDSRAARGRGSRLASP